MRIAVVGSRDYPDLTEIKHFIKSLSTECVIVSGGARGVDTAAVSAATEAGLGNVVYLPDWNKYGKSAGMIRNAEIVKNSDAVVAFWDGKSKGTKNTIDRALLADNIQYVKVFKYAKNT